MSDQASDVCGHVECAHTASERIFTLPTLITGARTVATLVLALLGAHEQSLSLLLWALSVYWVGDMADGAVARLTHRETRIGAVLDILCDRLSAAVFYVGFAWYDSSMVLPVGIYLAEFMVIDMFLSMAFLAWPLSSPNYFYLVDRRIWLWNWSVPGKALNSALFAVFMVWTRDVYAAGAVAVLLLAVKITSAVRLTQLRLPVPQGCAHTNANG
ncbi:MAG: CDP-alcohol phosphatidyltransferase family protein [Nocardioidaceae bacterium]